MQHLQTMVDEKQDQLIKKGEALVECQMSNVKTLCDLAQAMKERMGKEVEIEALKKSLEAGRRLGEEKEKENQRLREQLQQRESEQAAIQTCRDELKQVQKENSQLREKLQLQQKELDLQRELCTRKEEVQRSQTPFLLESSTSHQSRESVGKFWKWESRSPVTHGLFELYESQRDLFLLTRKIVRGDWLDHSQFLKIWALSCEEGLENLLAEILARKHLQLSDPHSAFLVIGDMGARVLLYYSSLESQWVNRRSLSHQGEKRLVSWQDYSTRISSQFYGQTQSSLCEWQSVLQDLYRQLQCSKFVSNLLSNNVQRLSMVSSDDLNASHYLFHYERTSNRLERYIKEASAGKRPLLNLHGQIQLELPPSSFSVPSISVSFPLTGSPLTLQYLGQYHRMFDSPQETPVPTWKALSWLLEDYGQSRYEDVPADIHYRRISRQWSPYPPPAVATHPNFCSCARRHKWDPQSTLHSVEYNWPLIPGPKATAAQCQVTYRNFFEEHIQHLDPVCFRAAVFCNTLATWCGQWNVTIDVNQFSESHHEFLLLLKLQYRPTRWVRLVEAMAITHFIAGAHRCLINEFPNTRAGPFERFLRWQRLHAPELVELDDDLRRAIEKMEIRDNKRAAEMSPHHQRPPHKPFGRHGC
jgi:hypothetical protein